MHTQIREQSILQYNSYGKCFRNLNSIKKYLNPIVLAPVHAILVRRAFFKPVAAEQLNSGP